MSFLSLFNSTDSLTDLSLYSLKSSVLSPEIALVVVKNLENIFIIYLCASRNQTKVAQMNVFAIKPYVKQILTLSNVHNRQY